MIQERLIALAYAPPVHTLCDLGSPPLVCLVEEFGSAHAEKSKLLHGIRYEMLATFGMSTSIDAAAAERFANARRVTKQTRLLNRMFDQQIRYTLAADASSIIRSVELSKPLLALFAACQVTKPRTPILKVRRWDHTRCEVCDYLKSSPARKNSSWLKYAG
jgi:hypothetical protein